MVGRNLAAPAGRARLGAPLKMTVGGRGRLYFLLLAKLSDFRQNRQNYDPQNYDRARGGGGGFHWFSAKTVRILIFGNGWAESDCISGSGPVMCTLEYSCGRARPALLSTFGQIIESRQNHQKYDHHKIYKFEEICELLAWIGGQIWQSAFPAYSIYNFTEIWRSAFRAIEQLQLHRDLTVSVSSDTAVA